LKKAQKAKGFPRLLAFNKRYGVNYTVLLAGDQADVAEKVPQIHNLNSFPTTIFIGRDGLVRAACTPGSGGRGERRVSTIPQRKRSPQTLSVCSPSRQRRRDRNSKEQVGRLSGCRVDSLTA
jgi:hypothetical protein